MYLLAKSYGFSCHHKHNLRLSIRLPILLIICLLCMSTKAEYGGGTGQPEDPYLIYTAEQMNEIGINPSDWDKHFKLMDDIDLSAYSGRDFNIIGKSRSSAFSGVFDGNNKKISNFSYSSANKDYAGLFSYVWGAGAEIRNLGLIDPNIDAGTGSLVGLLIGYLHEGTITNCYTRNGSVSGKNKVSGLIGYTHAGTITKCRVEGVSISGNDEVGGLVGHNRAEIEDCYSNCSVSGNSVVGGLIGENRGAEITNSYARGVVSASGDNVGGLVGENSNSGKISYCYYKGDIFGGRLTGGLVGQNSGSITNSCSGGIVSGEDGVGGLVGQSFSVIINNCYTTCVVSGDKTVGGLVGSSGGSIISNCYATGTVSGVENIGGLIGLNTAGSNIAYCYSAGAVTGTTDVGGLVGLNYEGVISASFWDNQTSGQRRMCGWQGTWATGCNDRNGKTTDEMQTENTFLNAGWDFVDESANGTRDIWSICERLDYPKLTWQFLIGDFDNDYRVDFLDFAVFAEHWLSSDIDFFWCRGADLTSDGIVDFSDLKEFLRNWLTDDISN